MTTQKRTLEILLKVLDQVSAPTKRISGVLKSTFDGAAAAVAKFRQTLNGTSAVITGVLAGAAVKAALAKFHELATAMDAVARTAEQVGVSASSFSVLQRAVEQAGVPMETLAGAMRTLTKNAGEAARGGAEQSAVFRRLGLDSHLLADGQQDAVAVFGQVSDALLLVNDHAERAALASKLFGDAGIALLPTIEKGEAELRRYAAAMQNAGLSLTDEDFARVRAYREAFDSFRVTLAALAQKVMVDVAPVLTGFFEDLRDGLLKNSRQVKQAIIDLLSVLGTMAEVFLKLAQVVGDVVRGWELMILGIKSVQASIEGNDVAMVRYVSQMEAVTRESVNAAKNTEQLSQQFERLRAAIREIGKEPAPIVRGTAAPVNVTAPTPEQGAKQFDWDGYWMKFKQGASDAIGTWADFERAGVEAGNAIVNSGLQGVTDAITDVVMQTKTAKEAARDFGMTMLRVLTQIIAKLIVVRTLKFFGYETGGVAAGEVQNTAPVEKFAMGGIVRSPTMALFGEGKSSKGEAFVPLPDGRRIPVHQTGGGGGTVNVTINAMDGADVHRVLSRERGLLLALWSDDAMRKRGTRQLIQGAAG